MVGKWRDLIFMRIISGKKDDATMPKNLYSQHACVTAAIRREVSIMHKCFSRLTEVRRYAEPSTSSEVADLRKSTEYLCLKARVHAFTMHIAMCNYAEGAWRTLEGRWRSAEGVCPIEGDIYPCPSMSRDLPDTMQEDPFASLDFSLDPSSEVDRTIVSSICAYWTECFDVSIQSGRLQTGCSIKLWLRYADSSNLLNTTDQACDADDAVLTPSALEVLEFALDTLKGSFMC